jgi:hypothetical protein
MKFQVTVKSNTAPPEYSTALFNGRLRGTFLEGSLKWIGEAAEVRGENGVEKLKLPKETTVKLLSFCPAVYSRGGGLTLVNPRNRPIRLL